MAGARLTNLIGAFAITTVLLITLWYFTSLKRMRAWIAWHMKYIYRRYFYVTAALMRIVLLLIAAGGLHGFGNLFWAARWDSSELCISLALVWVGVAGAIYTIINYNRFAHYMPRLALGQFKMMASIRGLIINGDCSVCSYGGLVAVSRGLANTSVMELKKDLRRCRRVACKAWRQNGDYQTWHIKATMGATLGDLALAY